MDDHITLATRLPVRVRIARTAGSLACLLAAASWGCSCEGTRAPGPPSGLVVDPSRSAASSGARGSGAPDSPPAAQGSVPLLLTADGGSTPPEGAVVSLGVPFPPGMLRDVRLLRVRDARGADVPTRAEPLAMWPCDGSIRSALVAFRAALPAREHALYSLSYGVAPAAGTGTGAGTGTETGAGTGAETGKGAEKGTGELLEPNPDGPVAATLPPSWYAASEVIGPQVPAVQDARFPEFETTIERGLDRMSPPYESYGVACDGKHRTYYDGPHALYQRFVRHGDAARYRRARAEAAWYRAHELRRGPDRALAVHVCLGESWTPDAPMPWNVIRRMLGQGMLDDYLLTGDPAAREAVVGMGELIRRSLPAMRTRKEDILLVSERNMAWAMMALSSYYAVEQRPEVREALRDLVDRTIAWQARGSSGAFEHDLNRVDPEECERGARGGSPFMTALLVDALMDYHTLTGDERVRDVVARAAGWLEQRALTSDRKAFRYLWGCDTDPYDDSAVADLNLMIVPVFGAAFALTGDARWIRLGDELADAGVREMRVSDPKHWNQAMRAFGKYLGYRARLEAPPVKISGRAGDK